MKLLIALALLTISTSANAVPVAAEITLSNGRTIVGYEEVTTTKKYNGWGGGKLGIFGSKKKQTTEWIPIYAAPVPEPSAYLMLLAGVGLITWRVNARPVE